MAYDIGPKITLKGESEFNRSIKNINDELKEYGSALKELDSRYESNEKNVDYYKEKIALLGKQIEAQKKKEQEYSTQLEKKKKLLQEQADKIEELTNAEGDHTKELQQAQREYDQTQSEISRLNTALNETKVYTNKATVELNDAVTELGKLESASGKTIAGLKSLGNGLTTSGEKMVAVGKKLSIASAAIAGLGVAAYKAWQELDEAYDYIAAGTGATGEALKELQGIYNDVYGSMPVEAEDAGVAIADVNTRLGLTGDALEEASSQFLKFSQVTGTDVSTAVETVSKAMSDAGISATELDSVLDTLTAVSQASGMSVDDLAGSLSTNGATMRSLGYTTEETIAMLATFEKAGMNSSTMLAGFKTAAKNAASAGKDGGEVIADFFQKVSDGSATAEDAVSTFGSKAGTTIWQYCQEGKLNFQEMTAVIESSSGQLNDSYEAMLDPADQWTVAMNNLKIVGSDLASVMQEMLAPVLDKLVELMKSLVDWWNNLSEPAKEAITQVLGIVAVVGPMLVTLGKVTTWAGNFVGTTIPNLINTFGTLKGALLTGFNAIKAGASSLFTLIMAHPVIAIITAIVAALVLLYTKCEWFRDAVNAIWEACVNFITEVWEGAVSFFTETLPNSFNQCKEQIKAAFDAIVNWFAELPGKVKAKFDEIVTNVTNWGASMWQAAVDACTTVVNKIVEVFTGLPGKAIQWGKDLLGGFIDGIKSKFSWLTDTVSGIAETITSWLHFSRPDEGPLRDYESWMPDMIDGMAASLDKSSWKLTDKIQALAESMQMDFSGQYALSGGEIVVNTPVYMDGRQIMKATNSALSRTQLGRDISKGG